MLKEGTEKKQSKETFSLGTHIIFSMNTVSHGVFDVWKGSSHQLSFLNRQD